MRFGGLFCFLLLLVQPGLVAAEFRQKIVSHFALSDPQVPFPVRETPLPKSSPVAIDPVLAGQTLLAQDGKNIFWLGSTNGAIRFDSSKKDLWDRVQYFASQRWLPDNEVKNIWVENPHLVWIRTKSAATRLEWKVMPLEEKARFFEAEIEQRHLRHGMVANSDLANPQDFSTSVSRSDDNDGLWTAMFLVSQCFHYKVTGEKAALQKARRCIDVLLKLESITGRPGFPARSYITRQEPKPGDGEWHETVDGQYLWKGDTSSDEIVGHFFGYAAYYRMIATPVEKKEIAAVIKRIMDHIIDHGFHLVDLDGKPTRWGKWSPEYFQSEEGKGDAPLNTLELLSFLKTTFAMTGEQKYQDLYLQKIQEGFLKHVAAYRSGGEGMEINFSDDELEYLSWWPLMTFENDPKLLRQYRKILGDIWGFIQNDHSPLWHYMTFAMKGKNASAEWKESCARDLNRVPLDLRHWSVQNSHRLDLQFHPEKDRFGKQQAVRVLPPDERPMGKWNANPYIPDGGSAGRVLEEGTFYLLPYWMGRYYGWIN